MNAAYLRADSLAQAIAWLREHPQARLLAGGQSLLAAMRLGLAQASHLIDVQDVAELQAIAMQGDTLWIGAMTPHAAVARNAVVRTHLPMLADMAGHIADPQVREVGTLGGSLAHHDPSACWPAAVLACGAQVVTSQRTLDADDFFQGLFATALAPDEVLLGVRFPAGRQGAYCKHEHPASRFAMPGVAVVRQPNGAVRVAITGLGQGVMRWREAESALQARWSQHALDALPLAADQAEDDLFASAAYKVHLARVLCRRNVAALTGETPVALAASAGAPARQATVRGAPREDTPSGASPGANTATRDDTGHGAGHGARHDTRDKLLHGEHHLSADMATVWHALLDPEVLRDCVPGCEHIAQEDATHYSARVKVGLGPISARLNCRIVLHPVQPPKALHTDNATRASTENAARLRLDAHGHAGALGQASAQIDIQLTSEATGTCLRWQAAPQLQGQLAQFGQRLLHSSARHLSGLFFERLAARLGGQPLQHAPSGFLSTFCQRLQGWWHSFFQR